MIKFLLSMLLIILPSLVDACNNSTINTPAVQISTHSNDPRILYLNNNYALITTTTSVDVYNINTNGSLGSVVQSLPTGGNTPNVIEKNGNIIAINYTTVFDSFPILYSFNSSNGNLTQTTVLPTAVNLFNCSDMAFSTDGQFLTLTFLEGSGNPYGAVVTYNIVSNTIQQNLIGNISYGQPSSISYSPTDNYAIVSYKLTNNTRIFQRDGSGNLISPVDIPTPAGFSGLEQTIFSPNGQFVTQIYSNGTNGGIVIYSYSTGNLTPIFNEHSGAGTISARLAFSPDNSVVTAYFSGDQIRVYSLSSTPSNQQNIDISGSSPLVLSLIYSPNGSFLAVATNAASNNIFIYSVCNCINITPALLPSGSIDQTYNQVLTATNGAAPYTFSITSGSLPNGLNLSSTGVISGNPTTNQLSQFTVNVVDANGCSSSQVYQLVIGSNNTQAIAYINTINTTNATTTIAGQQLILSVENPTTGVAPFTYSWISNDPLFVDPGTQFITVIPQNNNQYRATVTDSLGNIFYSNVFTSTVTNNLINNPLQSDLSSEIRGGRTLCSIQAVCTQNPYIRPQSPISVTVAGSALTDIVTDDNNNQTLQVIAFNTNLTQTVSAGNSVQLQITSSIALSTPLTYVLVGSDGSTVTQIDNSIFLVQPESDTTYYGYIIDSNGVQTINTPDLIIRYGTTNPVQGITVTNEGPPIV